MHPILLEFGGFTVYSCGVRLAAAYILGLQFALMRTRTRGLPAQRIMDPGIWILLVPRAAVMLCLLGRRLDPTRGAAAQQVAA